MPRTKVTKASKVKHNNEAINQEEKEHLVQMFNETIEVLEEVNESICQSVDEYFTALFEKTGPRVLNMTIGELKKMPMPALDDLSTTNSTVTSKKNSLLNKTRNTKKTKTSLSRSNSMDEGYRTYDSSNSGGPSRVQSQTRGRPKSKLKPKATMEKRASRSLSRTAMNGFFTPAHQKKANFDVVTPKCKPNTPLLMRRVRQGEVALSFQGSPLIVNPVVEDSQANLNIPLGGGTMLSLQPHDGLRLSHIPAMDPETLKQLETLNKHINRLLENNFN